MFVVKIYKISQKIDFRLILYFKILSSNNLNVIDKKLLFVIFHYKDIFTPQKRE